MCSPAWLDECARLWRNQFKGTDSVEKFKFTGWPRYSVTKSLAMISRHSCRLNVVSCVVLLVMNIRLGFVQKWCTKSVHFFFCGVVSFVCTPCNEIEIFEIWSFGRLVDVYKSTERMSNNVKNVRGKMYNVRSDYNL